MAALLVFGIFIVLIIIGVPIGISLGTAGIGAIVNFGLGIPMISRNFEANISKFPLIAIPFFILAGTLMDKAKIVDGISRFIILLVGKRRGGLAVAGVITCIFWGAVSGSGPATAAALGLVFIMPMIKQGYNKYFAAATIAAGAGLSIVIPPSIAFIVYGNLTNVSVGALFLGGILPGVLVGLFLIGVVYIISRRNNFRGADESGTPKEILKAFVGSFWALLAPVIILGSIYAGIATPTESAIIGVFYALFVGVFIYRTITINVLFQAMADTVVGSAVVMFVVSMAGIFSWAASTLGVIDAAAGLVSSLTTNKLVFMFLTMVIVLIAGMFLDAISIMYVFMPIIMPALAALHIDPLYFGICLTVALAIGQITPPVAVNLYVTANLIKSNIDNEMIKFVLPMVYAAVFALVVIVLIPRISLYLPLLSKLYTP
ncbi:MAG: TRAP transporter large permease [Rectinema subterraneum]|uniref:TRAP transporter large permease n=1 Tax=Rectinema subterraneum TaxID=2653714 RepID=UPI003C7D93CD